MHTLVKVTIKFTENDALISAFRFNVNKVSLSSPVPPQTARLDIQLPTTSCYQQLHVVNVIDN